MFVASRESLSLSLSHLDLANVKERRDPFNYFGKSIVEILRFGLRETEKAIIVYSCVNENPFLAESFVRVRSIKGFRDN